MDHLSILFKNDNNLKCLIRSIFNPRDTFPSHLSDLGIAIAIIKIPPDQCDSFERRQIFKTG